MFENIPPWALAQMGQQQAQGQPFNPAPMIMSPYGPQGSGGGARPPPQMPMPAGASTQPVGMGTQLQGLLGNNPNATASNSNNPAAAGMGSGGLLQLMAAMQNGRQQNPQLSPDQLSSMGITPSQMTGQYQAQQYPQFTGNPNIDSQMTAPQSSGGFMSWLQGLFGGGGGQ